MYRAKGKWVLLPAAAALSSQAAGAKGAGKLDELGVECYVQYKHKPSSRYRSLNDFLVKKLKGRAGSQR